MDLCTSLQTHLLRTSARLGPSVQALRHPYMLGHVENEDSDTAKSKNVLGFMSSWTQAPPEEGTQSTQQQSQELTTPWPIQILGQITSWAPLPLIARSLVSVE